MLPRLTVQEYEGKEYASLQFTAKTARQGTIRLGQHPFDVVMGQRYVISGRYDRPYTTLLWNPADKPNYREWWWGADEICAMREVEGQFYTTTTTPLGDRLIVTPYDGEFGVLEVTAGGRDIDKLQVSGSLRSKDVAVPVGQHGDRSGSLEPIRRCRLPVGDYLPSYLTFEFGRFRISVSDNYHSDGSPRDFQRQRIYGITIRKDKPFALNFSAKPAVMFASPAKDQTFRPGDEINVMAVLTDPTLGIMIRGLNDTTRKQKETLPSSDGSEMTMERDLSLDPVVTITDASGHTVSKGKMPFG